MIEVLNLEKLTDQNLYLEALDYTKNKSPYHSIDFFRFFSSGLKNLICLRYQVNGDIILLPGYLREIPLVEGYKDFISPYGYSGPIINPLTNRDILTEFWKIADQWFKSENIVTVFIRFSLDENHKFFSGHLHCTMLNIRGSILESSEEQWQKYDRKVRKNVNRAHKEGLVSEILSGQDLTKEHLMDFCEIYWSTMERTKAKRSFYYTVEDFQNFLQKNSAVTVFVFVKDHNIITSVEMVLLSDDSAFSFLGGTLENHFANRPNDLLKHDLVNWLRNKNYKYFILGGGYGHDDGIYRYKKSFFPDDIEDYFTGRSIINEALYNELIDKENDSRRVSGLPLLEKNDTSFFPLYRKQN
jgi:hypothetical protein